MSFSLMQNQLARLAGFTYLVLIITGVFSLMYVPNQLIDWDNAAKTIESIKGNLRLLNSVFWGLWLFPFGYLVFKSGFLPKFLGVFLMLGCLGYLVEFVGRLFIKDYYDTILSDIAGFPSQIGEFGICLWLMIFGTRTFSFSKNKK
ncbi:DUF4386 domain-containing protein [Arcticibacterium luteifluviistationis]|uniref:DUF4386 domain-containing protein n=1 Tax=Arcticibacterium luteifluviistationis TaxID=1784714 RepID=A0A2Z4GDH1_9BACT|nr:DUF4386 domain-containing protein [Arcticibacterium luteifluviistationis]AWV99075.1 hypothetical protein DJ013_13230 [Arcticibacterium luteifluviistationis]